MADSRPRKARDLSPPDVAGDRHLGRSLRLGRVSCLGCGRLVGLVWFGKGPELVDPIPVWTEDGPVPGLALMLHVCPVATDPKPTTGRSDPATGDSAGTGAAAVPGNRSTRRVF